MPEVIIKKNSGTKFLVMLVGHDRSLGQIECIVSLPAGVKVRSTEEALRRLAAIRAADLAQQFHKALISAGLSSAFAEHERVPVMDVVAP